MLMILKQYQFLRGIVENVSKIWGYIVLQENSLFKRVCYTTFHALIIKLCFGVYIVPPPSAIKGPHSCNLFFWKIPALPFHDLPFFYMHQFYINSYIYIYLHAISANLVLWTWL